MIQRPESSSETDPTEGPDAQIEAMLFVARDPLPERRIAELLDEPVPAIRASLARLQGKFGGERRGIHLVEIGGGWRFLTNPRFADVLTGLTARKGEDRLSPAALETLAIVAYKQPVSRAEIERIRGVGVGPIVRHLLELNLLKVAGREEGIGRALLYGTTRDFLDRFGLGALKDLPASLEI